MRLIDAKALEQQVKEVFKENPVVMGIMIRWIRKQNTVDAAPVVRCKDCKHSYDDVGERVCTYGVCVDCVVPEDFFCSYGERKDGDDAGR